MQTLKAVMAVVDNCDIIIPLDIMYHKDDIWCDFSGGHERAVMKHTHTTYVRSIESNKQQSACDITRHDKTFWQE